MFRNPYADALILLLVVLLIFGPKRLPTLGKSLGQGLREFKDSITGSSKDDEAEERPAISASSATPGTGLSGSPAPTPAAEPAPVESSAGRDASGERASSSAEVSSGPSS